MGSAARHNAVRGPVRRMRPSLRWRAAVGLVVGLIGSVHFAAPAVLADNSTPPVEEIAGRLSNATVTVRIIGTSPLFPAPNNAQSTDAQPATREPGKQTADAATDPPAARPQLKIPTRSPQAGPAASDNKPEGAAAATPAAAPARDGAAASGAASGEPGTTTPESAEASSGLPRRGLIVTPQMAGILRDRIGNNILVGSGVSLGGGLIVTFYRGPSDVQYRITLPEGKQALARLLVQDQYSGLCLLQADITELPAVDVSAAPPAIGAWILSAGASGIDRALVSQGIVGGADRMPPGSDLPPLLQCDIRTTETSCGAGIVDRQGKLVGIVAAVSDKPAAEGDPQAGWTFVVPAKYVARLLAARLDNETIVLKRQRPSVGLTLVPGPELGTIIVESVTRRGPAEAAGIQAGDLILETDGRAVRSPLQVMSLAMRKQPGEKLALLVASGDDPPRQVQLTLSTALPDEAPPPAGTLVEPRSGTAVTGPNQLEVRRTRIPLPLPKRSSVSPPADGQPGDAAPAANNGSKTAATPTPAAPSSPAGTAPSLSEQMAALEQAIQQLRAQLKERDRRLSETSQQVERLNAELERLRLGDGEGR